jgi:hypothetical protein
MNSISRLAADPQIAGCLLSEPHHLSFDDLGVTQRLYAKLQGMRETGAVEASPPIAVRASLG